MDLKPCEYRCPTCGRLDPFNQTIEDALRAEIAEEEARCDEFMNINEWLNLRITKLLARIDEHKETICDQGECIALLRSATGWRSMESAPKTVPVLAVVDGDVRIVRYGKTSHVPLYGWCIADMGPEEVDLCEPTHWMPLPAAPEAHDA